MRHKQRRQRRKECEWKKICMMVQELEVIMSSTQIYAWMAETAEEYVKKNDVLFQEGVTPYSELARMLLGMFCGAI